MEKAIERYTYDEYKDTCSDVRDFYESLDLSKLDESDLKKINILKDTWVEYCWRFVSLSYYGEERAIVTSKIFEISNSIKNEQIREENLKFAYQYVIELTYEDVIYGNEKETINKSLESIGLFSMDTYESYCEQVESLKMILKRK